MCIFCKIINGDIPSKKVYEDENTLAILDISQATKGHTLILPKKHYANLLEINNDDYLNVMNAVKIVTNKLNKAFNPDGFNILNNCNEAAGQTVMHFHVHIIPRYKNDDLKIEFTSHSYNLDEVLNQINEGSKNEWAISTCR